MSEFKRENRYMVIKWPDAVAALGTRDLDRLQGIANAVAEHRVAKGKAPLSCVVVEADWPIYERVWDEIQRLEDGKCIDSESAATIKGLQEVPEGWQLVPVVPTVEMLDEILMFDGFTQNALRTRYRALLAAAPKPTEDKD